MADTAGVNSTVPPRLGVPGGRTKRQQFMTHHPSSITCQISKMMLVANRGWRRLRAAACDRSSGHLFHGDMGDLPDGSEQQLLAGQSMSLGI